MRKKKGKLATMHEKYVESVIAGEPKTKAALMAGYAPSTKPADIERVGGAVHNLMTRALAERGITEEFVASEYKKGLSLSVTEGASDIDCQAHAKYLLQLGYLLGYGKQGPSVAVQINNNPASGLPHEPERITDALREIGNVLKMVREELGARGPGDVSGEGNTVAGGDSVSAEAAPCEGVVQPGEAAR